MLNGDMGSNSNSDFNSKTPTGDPIFIWGGTITCGVHKGSILPLYGKSEYLEILNILYTTGDKRKSCYQEFVGLITSYNRFYDENFNLLENFYTEIFDKNPKYLEIQKATPPIDSIDLDIRSSLFKENIRKMANMLQESGKDYIGAFCGTDSLNIFMNYLNDMFFEQTQVGKKLAENIFGLEEAINLHNIFKDKKMFLISSMDHLEKNPEMIARIIHAYRVTARDNRLGNGVYMLSSENSLGDKIHIYGAKGLVKESPHGYDSFKGEGYVGYYHYYNDNHRKVEFPSSTPDDRKPNIPYEAEKFLADEFEYKGYHVVKFKADSQLFQTQIDEYKKYQAFTEGKPLIVRGYPGAALPKYAIDMLQEANVAFKICFDYPEPKQISVSKVTNVGGENLQVTGSQITQQGGYAAAQSAQAHNDKYNNPLQLIDALNNNKSCKQAKAVSVN